MAFSITFKVANMRKEQEFTLYPYKGGDNITLQSDKRFAVVNLRTGEGKINDRNKNYSSSVDLQLNPIPMTLPEEIKTAIQSHLWHNEGNDGNVGGVLSYSNAELFANKG